MPTVFAASVSSCSPCLKSCQAPEACGGCRGRRWRVRISFTLGTIWGLIGWGLIRMHGWARLAAMLLIAPGMSFGVVTVITASRLHWWLLPVGLQILVGLVVVWYLFTDVDNRTILKNYKDDLRGGWTRASCPYVVCGYFFAFAGSFSPTRLLTSKTILPAFLSASTTTWSPCSTSPSRIFSASGS